MRYSSLAFAIASTKVPASTAKQPFQGENSSGGSKALIGAGSPGEALSISLSRLQASFVNALPTLSEFPLRQEITSYQTVLLHVWAQALKKHSFHKSQPPPPSKSQARSLRRVGRRNSIFAASQPLAAAQTSNLLNQECKSSSCSSSGSANPSPVAIATFLLGFGTILKRSTL